MKKWMQRASRIWKLTEGPFIQQLVVFLVIAVPIAVVAKFSLIRELGVLGGLLMIIAGCAVGALVSTAYWCFIRKLFRSRERNSGGD